MHIEKLPSWMHKDIDKAVKRCVWDTKKDIRGVHLLNRETLIRPKKLGGVNLKSAKMMNMALLAKLGWRLMSNPGELWCKVLKSKYKVKDEDDAYFKEKQRSSNI